MKNLIIITVLCMIAQQSFSQDKIVKLNGETINCKVTEIAISAIKYQDQDEDIIRHVLSNQVHKIIFKSGKVEEINKNIVINGEDDWERIQIVNSDFDVSGLTKGEVIETSVNGAGRGYTEEMALQKIKKIAASKGYHTVVILKTSGQGSHSGKSRGGSRTSLTGLGYTY